MRHCRGTVKRVREACKESGWKMTLTRRNHYRLESPDGYIDFHSSTPIDVRGERNWLSRLRRKGLPI